MSFTRPILFWIAMLAAVAAVVVLLREVLLPFVAGMVLAYLLDPVANRIEQLGVNRLVATLVIITVVIAAIALLIAWTVPVIIRELEYFFESFPEYIRRLQSLTTDPTRPWLSKIVGEGLRSRSGRSARSRHSRAAGSRHFYARYGRGDEPSFRSSRWLS